MNARFYVSGIGRFASPDTIVPNPANPQSYNRYSYVENRPLRFVDPTGHSCDNPLTFQNGLGDSEASACTETAGSISQMSGGLFNLDLTTKWEVDEIRKLLQAVQSLISGLNGDLDLLSALIGGQSISLKRNLSSGLMGWDPANRAIHVFSDIMQSLYTQDSINWAFAHEIGHVIETTFASATAFIAATGGAETYDRYDTIQSKPTSTYRPGGLDTATERHYGWWATNSHRGPSEDWADTFATLTVCPNCVAQLFQATPVGGGQSTSFYGPGLILGGNGPSPRHIAYYNSVLERAANSIPGGR